MTVANTPRVAGPFTGTGADASLPFSFKVFADSDLLVQRTVGDDPAEVLSLGSDYEVTLNDDQDNDPGGSVEIDSSAYDSGCTVYVTSQVEVKQVASLIDQGGYSPTAIEQQLDRIVMAQQELRDQFLLLADTTGADLFGDLRTSLAADGGAALVGIAGGGTLEDAIFARGRATAIAGSKAQINWLRDDASSPLENQASIWTGKLVIDHGLNKRFTSADGQTDSPSTTLFVRAVNDNSPADVVAGMFLCVAAHNNSIVYGANILAIGTGKDGCRLVGIEVDIEPTLADTNLSAFCAGIVINAFNLTIPGTALVFGSVNGGKFANGILFGNIANTGTCLALDGSGHADSLINATVGTIHGVAVTLGATKPQGLLYTDGVHMAYSWFDGTNRREVLAAGGGFAFRNSTDSASLLGINDNGTGGSIDAAGTGGKFLVNGTQVLSARSTGWATQTATPSKADLGASPTVGQIAAWASAVDAMFKAHGFAAVA